MCISAAAYAPMHINRDISSDLTPLDKKKKGGKRPKPLPPKVHTDYTGHPYSSGIYEVLRMVRKLTKSKS